MILMTMLRLAIRFAVVRDLGLDDATCVLAMFIGIGSIISLSLAVDHGLGEKYSIRDDSQTWALQKDIYSASILCLLCIGFAKISTLVLTTRLTPNHTHLVVVWGVTVFVSLWALSAVFANAFRCSVPHTFDLLGGHCIAIYAFWDAISAIDILTDLIIIGLAFWFFGGLHIRLGPKLIVLSTFACRLFVVAATVSRLVYLNRLKSSSDVFFVSIPFLICTQVQQAISVIVTSIPTLKTFVDRTYSGMLNVSLKIHTGTTYGEANRKDNCLLTSRSQRSAKSPNKPPKPSSKKDITTSASDEINGAAPDTATLFRPKGIKFEAMVTGGHRHDAWGNGLNYTATNQPPNGPNYSNSRGGSEDEIEGEIESLESQGSNKMIIKVRKDWKVTPYQREN
ncbi:hypothetical protein DV736_g6110, partial [Chaetothyriales sp. CBS 134916]